MPQALHYCGIEKRLAGTALGEGIGNVIAILLSMMAGHAHSTIGDHTPTVKDTGLYILISMQTL